MKTLTLRWSGVLGAVFLTGTLLAGCGASPKAPAAPATTLPPPAGTPVSGQYGIASTSTASYTAHERFLQDNLPNVPVGVTHGVSGPLLLTGGRFEPSTVTVNLIGLKTDSSMRDRHVQQTLDTARYPDATFQITGEASNAQLVRAQGVAAVRLQGKLTIHGVTHAATWALDVGLVGGDLKVTGTTTIQMTAFGVRPPNLAGFVKVQPTILLSVDLEAAKS